MDNNLVLVVEDDKEIREGIVWCLKSQGYDVAQAGDGLEGLELVTKTEPILAIVDVMMPRMDGVTMVMKLREKYDFPVIMLSAKVEEVDKILGLNMGADDYIAKPFRTLELLARVNFPHPQLSAAPEPGGGLTPRPGQQSIGGGRSGAERRHHGGHLRRQTREADTYGVQNTPGHDALSRQGFHCGRAL